VGMCTGAQAAHHDWTHGDGPLIGPRHSAREVPIGVDILYRGLLCGIPFVFHIDWGLLGGIPFLLHFYWGFLCVVYSPTLYMCKLRFH